MKAIGEIMRDQNIRMSTPDMVLRGGFTQVPNAILRAADLSMGAKLTYAMFLSYAWNNDNCFPGQDRLATDIGMSRASVSAFIQELEKKTLITIERRGLGKTNIYTVHSRVMTKPRASRGQPADFQMSAG